MGSWSDIDKYLGNYHLSEEEIEDLLMSVLKGIDTGRTNPERFAEQYRGDEFDHKYGEATTLQAEGYLCAHFLITKPHGHIPAITDAGQRVIERGWVLYDLSKDKQVSPGSLLKFVEHLSSLFR